MSPFICSRSWAIVLGDSALCSLMRCFSAPGNSTWQWNIPFNEVFDGKMLNGNIIYCLVWVTEGTALSRQSFGGQGGNTGLNDTFGMSQRKLVGTDPGDDMFLVLFYFYFLRLVFNSHYIDICTYICTCRYTDRLKFLVYYMRIYLTWVYTGGCGCVRIVFFLA